MNLQSKAQQLSDMAHTASGWLIIAIIGFASFMAVYSGWHFITGSRDGSEKGKKILKGAGIGLAISILSWAVMQGLATWLSGFAN